MTTAVPAAEHALRLADLVADTPDVVVDAEVLRANILRAAAVAREAGVKLRPHAKTHKLPEVARMQIDAGAVGIQVAKLGEAEVMVDAGIEDVLVGYPIVGEQKLRRLVALAERARISVSLDSLEVGEGIAQAAQGRGIEVTILVEIDTGLARLGVQPGGPAADLAERLAMLPGLSFGGVFTHEGHVYTAGRTTAERKRMTEDACARVAETAEEIRRRGLEVATVSVGSAGTFRFAVYCPGVTEVRPGTYVFNDRSQLAQEAATEEDIAAFVVTTVVGRPVADRVVIDAGSKVLSSDRMLVADSPASYGRVIGHDDWNLTRLSEEHGILSVPASATVAVGDRLLVVPNHICPVINLATELTVVGADEGIERWSVAGRGRVQ